jgi:hypothetical protein
VTSVNATQIVYQIPSVVTGVVGGTAVVRPAIINGTPYNVYYIAKLGTGFYQIGFTNALSDSNYSIVVNGGEGIYGVLPRLNTLNTNYANFYTNNYNNGAMDTSLVCVQVFGN